MDAPLVRDQLERLSRHGYSVSGKSLLEPYFQVFWNAALNYCPLSIAPNTLTLLGLLLNAVSTLLLIYFSPDAASDVPPFVLLFAAFSLFSYQLLDALDGKQARRTGSASPLGELFDHGCDAFSTVFVSLAVSISCCFGSNCLLMFIQFNATMFLFYMAHWQAYVTGTVEFGKLDVTEGQVAIIIIQIVAAFTGVKLFAREFLFCITLGRIQFFVMISSGIAMFARFSRNILYGGRGKNGTTIALLGLVYMLEHNTSVLFPIIPIVLLLAMEIFIAVRSPSSIYHVWPCLYLLTFGIVASKIICWMVIAHMTKSEMVATDTILIYPFLMIINIELQCPLNEFLLLCICSVLSLYDVLRFAFAVCNQITSYMHIYMFSLDRPPPPAALESSKDVLVCLSFLQRLCDWLSSPI